MSSFDESEEDIEMGKARLLEEEPPANKNPPPPPKKGLRSNIVDGACILLNIASTVVLVFLNKWYVSLTIANMEMDAPGPGLVLNHSLTMNPQDLPRPPTQEYANNLCNVAFHLHIHRPLHCLSLSLQPLRTRPAAILADDTPL